MAMLVCVLGVWGARSRFKPVSMFSWSAFARPCNIFRKPHRSVHGAVVLVSS